ncbi:MAG: stalk domain-containing protein [Defluviitaleaceae bacterium]|nr:stalk domain-containing protein [Defluviitaleaceae bacterium]
MKKLFACVFFVAISIATVYAAEFYEDYEVYEPAEIAVTVNGVNLHFPDQAPAVVDERVLVPVRAVFERLGFGVMWSESSQAIVLSRQNDTVLIIVGDAEFVTNGEGFELDVPAQIIGERVVLPVRAVLESVGYIVEWDEPSRTVQIFTPIPPEPPPLPGPPEALPIPGHRLTYYEIGAWITNYHERGGINNFESEVVRLTNIERENADLPPLEPCYELMLSARFKAQSMHDLGYFSHTSPIYGAFQNISFEVFNIPVQSIGENLANGHRTPEAVVHGWMNSEGHRNNILNERYTRIGIGFFEYFWAQKFLG